MELWMVGLALGTLLVMAARDVGRAGRASAAGLVCLRAVGGLGLGAMALLALRYGQPQAALVAAVGAAPLIGGLVTAGRRQALARRPVLAREARAGADTRYAVTAEERRAA